MNNPTGSNTGEPVVERQLLPSKTHDIESVHRDLAFANAYRQEFIKSLILIAGALFAFSVTFRPDLRIVNHEELFWVAWIGLGASMVGGFAQLAAWERLYSSYQRFDYRAMPDRGAAYRKTVTLARRVALVCQVSGFIIGVAALGSFTAMNLANFEKKAPGSPALSRPPAASG
jgi:hypothetical protein